MGFYLQRLFSGIRITVMSTMNQIPVIQNAEPQLRLLRAQRHLYQQAKHLLYAHFVLTVVLPMAGATATLFWPTVKGIDLKGVVALLSLAITVLDVTLLERFQKATRKKAAKLQEQFDCTVLELPWNKFTVGARVGPEAIHAAASKHLGGRADPTLLNC